MDTATYATYRLNMTYPNSFGMRPTLKQVPTTTNMTVFTTMKTKPVTMEGERTTLDSGLPVVIARDENPKLRPIRMLKTGPAKHAVYTKTRTRISHTSRDKNVARTIIKTYHCHIAQSLSRHGHICRQVRHRIPPRQNGQAQNRAGNATDNA